MPALRAQILPAAMAIGVLAACASMPQPESARSLHRVQDCFRLNRFGEGPHLPTLGSQPMVLAPSLDTVDLTPLNGRIVEVEATDEVDLHRMHVVSIKAVPGESCNDR